ncbi:MAG: isoprenyl transferase [Acutalibacteraceae bacterium]|nr:isoprenyl transferase [Acutalibacteraceae bacterium]
MFKKKHTVDFNALPKHIGIIMDGNGRWAKKRGLPRTAGHSVGAKTFKTIARYCNKIGIEYLTVYAFSTENWKRPKDEVDTIMKLLKDYLVDAKNFKDENIKVKFIGDLTPLTDELKQLIIDAEEGSKDATGLNLNIALNYGGRDEIVYAVKQIADEIKSGNLETESITEQTISDRIYTANQPDPDIIIRPSGEFRLSNFMIWQAAYSEFWYSSVLWPDFKPKHLDMAIIDYQKRSRRFGGV